MFCRKCGIVIPDDSLFCEKCGEKISNTKDILGNVDTNTENIIIDENINKIEKSSQLPMNWYKFLIYFSMPVGIILNGNNVVKLISDLSKTFNGSIIQNKIYVILYISYISILVIMQIAATLKLYDKKIIGIKLFLVFTVMFTLENIVEFIFCIPLMMHNNVLGYVFNSMYARYISALLGGTLIFVANYQYFNKRKSMFS